MPKQGKMSAPACVGRQILIYPEYSVTLVAAALQLSKYFTSVYTLNCLLL